MVGNVALDVVIGLVFIYLLYSLYATVIMEIISSFFGLRSKNLCYALSRMLMDEKEYSNAFRQAGSRIATTLIRISGRFPNMTNRRLYDHFFGQPSIKYLSSGGVGNKPSYLSAENFSKGIMDAIKTDNPEMSVLACIEEGLENLPGTGETSETKRHLISLLADANNDLAKFKILLENWYNDTMDRASGWFKQSTQAILLLIGLTFAVSFNLDTIAIIRKLSNDEDARDQLVKMATDFTQDNSQVIDAIRNKKDTSQSVEALKIQLDSLLAIRRSLNEDIQMSRNILSSDWNIASNLHYSVTAAKSVDEDSIEVSHKLKKGGTVYVTVHKSIDPKILQSILPDVPDEGLLKISTLWYKLKYVFNLDHVWGYLLTVLALSLGAPFWFDLLNKLIKLRTSKVAAEGSAPASGTTGSLTRATLNRAG